MVIVLDGGGVDEEGKLTATGGAAPGHEAEGTGMWRMPTGRLPQCLDVGPTMSCQRRAHILSK